MKRLLQVVTGRSLPVRAGLGAAAAAVVLMAGCSSGHSPDQRSSTAAAKRSAAAARQSASATAEHSPSTLLHWGSYFGGRKGRIFDIQTSPVAVTVPGTVAEVGTSNSTEYALLTDGTLYAWGLGTHGQLGDGGRTDSFTKPVRVRFPAGVKIASIPTDVMPYNTGLAVDTNGNAWGWGLNHGGELCLGNTRLYRTPVKLPLHQVTTLAGASNHALYDAAGTVYACGQNLRGDLGDGRMRSSTRPVKVAGLNGLSVIQLVASFANSGALLANGKYYDWGYNAGGQLGDGRAGHFSDVPVLVHLPHPVRQVAQGGSIWNNGQTLVMLSDGSTWAWGNDRASQLGDGLTGVEPLPVRFYPPAGVTYRSLATGSATSYAVSTTGKVYAWGVSHVGQVGNGHTQTAVSPVLVASGATRISATANNVVISVPKRA
jgi:alpha-tubulin suppressor-like RCC1 family protein